MLWNHPLLPDRFEFGGAGTVHMALCACSLAMGN